MMTLPCCFNTFSDLYKLYDGSMIFTRKFLYARQKDDERMILKIGAANYLCRVFLNKKYVGMHRGSSTPCYFDLTDLLKHENRILIQVDSTRRNNQVPALDTDWFNYGGIYRDIELIRVPKVHVKEFKIALEPDSNFRKIRVFVRMSEEITGTAILTIRELGIEKEIPVLGGRGSFCLRQNRKSGHRRIRSFMMWSFPVKETKYVTVSVSGKSVSREWILS